MKHANKEKDDTQKLLRMDAVCRERSYVAAKCPYREEKIKMSKVKKGA